MKNKGFTLVELLGVITLLSILIGFVMTKASNTISKANREYYKTQERLFVLSAKDYFQDYRSKLPKETNETSEVFLATLEDELYIDQILDVNKNLCSSLESKVIVTKQSDSTYQYQAYLVCPKANYQTKLN